jgi:hypothetical protein
LTSLARKSRSMVSSGDLIVNIKADILFRESRLASCEAPGTSRLTAAYIDLHTHNGLGLLQE